MSNVAELKKYLRQVDGTLGSVSKDKDENIIFKSSLDFWNNKKGDLAVFFTKDESQVFININFADLKNLDKSKVLQNINDLNIRTVFYKYGINNNDILYCSYWLYYPNSKSFSPQHLCDLIVDMVENVSKNISILSNVK